MKTSVILVNAQMHADLNWKQHHIEAQKCKEEGSSILWEIDLGIFEAPLNDKTQFMALSLALDHFRETLWQTFKDVSCGVSLYQGTADFLPDFPWNLAEEMNFKGWIQEQFLTIESLSNKTGIFIATFDEVSSERLSSTAEGRRIVSLFCRNAVSEYLHLLAARLPDEVPLSLSLHVDEIQDPYFKAQLLSKTCFDRFQLEPFQHSFRESRIGFCLPPVEHEILSNTPEVKEAFKSLLESHLSVKVIPEETLISEWDGLDWVVFASNSLGTQGKRKLQGFCAAGGTCVAIGKLIGLPQEISFIDWKKDL